MPRALALNRFPSSVLLMVLLLTTPISFGVARMEYICNEKPARHLTWDLGNVLAGEANIKTDNNTYAVLSEFQLARQMARAVGQVYCVIPDLSANWGQEPTAKPAVDKLAPRDRTEERPACRKGRGRTRVLQGRVGHDSTEVPGRLVGETACASAAEALPGPACPCTVPRQSSNRALADQQD